MRKEIIGDATLYLGDCLEILPTLPKVDAVITDPPYGIGEASKDHKSRNKLAGSPDYARSEWDASPLDAERLGLVLAAGRQVILWGGNYYPLPPSGKWLVWDKLNGANDFADAELAWTNIPGAVRVFRHMWAGMLRDSERDTPRVHPTQKPVALMRWCLLQICDARSVVDPCMGSGSAGIACVEEGVSYFGIEREPRYFDIACERIENAQRQVRMFA